MSSFSETPMSQTSMPPFPHNVPFLLSTWAGNFQRQTSSAFARMTAKDYIRLVIIVGGYALIVRPLMLKLGAKLQAKQHGAAAAAAAADADGRPGGGRRAGEVQIPGVDSEDEGPDEQRDKADPRTGEWGRKARLRQRRMVREMLDAKEKMAGAQESDDEDIMEFLED